MNFQRSDSVSNLVWFAPENNSCLSPIARISPRATRREMPAHGEGFATSPAAANSLLATEARLRYRADYDAATL
jgi:hypothetical protein